MILDPHFLSFGEPRKLESQSHEKTTPGHVEIRARPASSPSFSEIADQVAERKLSDAATVNGPNKKESASNCSFWENGDFGFADLLDIINPLQHLPIVATIYRNMTGDRLGMAPRVIGGALWGRIGGFVSGVINAVVEWCTGKDIGDHIFYAFFFDKPETTTMTSATGTQSGANAKSAGTLQKPKNEPDRTKLSHREDISRPVTSSDMYERQSSLWRAMIRPDLKGTSHYQNIKERQRAREQEHRIHLTA